MSGLLSTSQILKQSSGHVESKYFEMINNKFRNPTSLSYRFFYLLLISLINLLTSIKKCNYTLELEL